MVNKANIIIVGSRQVGKSALLLQFMYGEYFENFWNFDPPLIDSYTKVLLDDQKFNLEIIEPSCDWKSQEPPFAIQDSYFLCSDGFLCVFSIADQESLIAAREFHEQILRVKNDGNVPFVLVGNKADLEHRRVVSRQAAASQAAVWNVPYVETSAKTRHNVDKSVAVLLREIKKHHRLSSTSSSSSSSSPSLNSDDSCRPRRQLSE